MDSKRPEYRDITSITLKILFICLLIAAGFWTVRPFLTAVVWAIIIVVATWPAMLKMQGCLWGKRWMAVAAMTIGLLMLLVVPLSLAITTIVDNSGKIVDWIRSLSTLTISSPPEWLNNVPMVGPKLVVKWQHFASTSSQELSARLEPYLRDTVGWFVSQAGNVGMMILQFLLTVIISAILFATGETASRGVSRLAFRLTGSQGEQTLVLAAKAIRGVALGVVLTALIQSVLGGIGLVIVGIPAAMLLTAVMFLLCIAQLGPILILIACIVWLYWSGQTLWGTVLLIWSVPVVTLDNFLRPILIRKGADLPLLLIFAGVIGGLIAYGIIGLFIGPVVLGVIYTLLQAWVDEGAGETETLIADEQKP